MAERLTELEELRRWCKDSGAYPVLEVIDRWCNMPEITRAALRRKWRKEDEREEK